MSQAVKGAPASADEADALPSIEEAFESYSPRSDSHRRALIDPVFEWLLTSRHKNKVDMACWEIHERFKRMEEGILAHFARFEGGPSYVHKDEAWRLACRQREFVREACARMAEDEGGTPTSLSEAIREIDIGEHVRVIPDYSKEAAR